MPLTLILGPMKSGKSLELIAQATPFKYSKKSVCFYQPKLNVRDDNISSRVGSIEKATKIKSLEDIDLECDVIAIDEINMFQPSDIHVISEMLSSGKDIFICGLDLDYKGDMFEIIKKTYELKPETVIYKVAICDKCKEENAPFTQIEHKSVPVTEGLPSVIPEDGTYEYGPRCRQCFVQN